MTDKTRAPAFAIPVYIASGGSGNQGVPIAGAGGYQQLAVDTLQTLTVPALATSCLIIVEGAPGCRYTLNGTAPTAGAAGVGNPASPGSSFPIFGAAGMAAAQFIGMGAGCKINVSYFGSP